ncbi:hypothetical protein L195_g049265 [Trifolium pratense]|uniref:Transmembrane protein n=1 Tax=Trifolium pratense TaxID=57577 RepID=A0A2K3JNL5_TRIPR|nr:hypothetical protein L195_g049265 [Trifolium pratense]
MFIRGCSSHFRRPHSLVVSFNAADLDIGRCFVVMFVVVVVVLLPFLVVVDGDDGWFVAVHEYFLSVKTLSSCRRFHGYGSAMVFSVGDVSILILIGVPL